MRFVVSPDIFASYPEVRIGVLVLEDIDNRSKAGFAAELFRADSIPARSVAVNDLAR